MLTVDASDKYRSEAKRLAWYDDDEDGSAAFNPFKKHVSRTPKPRHDAEEGGSALQRTQSENIHSNTTRQSSDGPTHAETAPSYGGRQRQSISQDRPAGAEFNLPETPEPDDSVMEKAHTAGDADVDTNFADSNIEIQASIQNARATRRPWNAHKLFRRKVIGLDDTDTADTENKHHIPQFTFAAQLRATIFNSWLNLSFAFVPIGFAVNYTNQKPAIVFAINFLAIFPSGTMIAYALEEVMLRVGETLGGLLSMTFRYVWLLSCKIRTDSIQQCSSADFLDLTSESSADCHPPNLPPG